MPLPNHAARSALLAVPLLVAAPSASAQGPAGPLEGVWSGTATGCTGRGETPELRLALIHEAEVAIAVVTVIHRTRQRATERTIRARGQAEGPRLELETRISGPGGTFPADLPLRAALTRPGVLTVSSAVAGPGGTRCTGATLRRTGDLPTPDPAPFRALLGTWAGYDSGIGPHAPRRGQEPRLMPYQAARHLVIEIRDTGGRIAGSLAAARPVNERPARQDRFAATLRPTETPAGGPAFEKVVVTGSGAFDIAPRHRVVALTPRADGTLEATVQHINHAQATERFVLRRQSAEAVAALRGGEGPAMPLPEAAGGRLAEAISLDAQCRLIDAWASEPTGAKFGARAFPAVFGTAYDGADDGTLAFLGELLRLCGDRLGDPRLVDRAGGATAFLPTGREAVVARSAAAEQARDRAERAAVEAQAQAAIAARERAHATASLLAETRDLDQWPAERATLRRLADVTVRASHADLDPATRQRLGAQVRVKTEAIVAPILAGWRDQLAALPESLAGLDATRRLEAEAAALAREAGLAVPGLADHRRAIALGRARLVASETVQGEFLASLADLRSAPNGRAAIADRAGRHYTPEEFAGLTRGGPFGRAIDARVEALELAAIVIEDRSTGRVPGEPTAQEMLLAVKAPIDAYNAEIRETHARCSRGEAQGNPILAVQCISVMATGGHVDARITRFSKLGCERPELVPGYICDYAIAIAADNPMLGRMLEELGGGRQGIVTARFLRLDTGWQRMPPR